MQLCYVTIIYIVVLVHESAETPQSFKTTLVILTFGGPGTQSLIKFSPEWRGQDNAIIYHDKTLHHPRIHNACASKTCTSG